MPDDSMFCIELDYDRNEGNPARVFQTITDLVRTMDGLDADLINCLDSRFGAKLVLQDIEVGSVRSWFRSVLENIDDEDLRDLKWKRIVGKFLVLAKARLLVSLADHDHIADIREVKQIQDDIYQLAHDTGVNQLQAYTPPNDATLLYRMEQVSTALVPLSGTDRAGYVTTDTRIDFNPDFRITKEQIQDLLTNETKRQELDALLKVKKPDYLGQSRWEIQHEGHTVFAKIEDQNWLERFQRRQVDLRPGDALEARTRVESWLDTRGRLLDQKYTVLEVRGIVPMSESPPLPFPEGDDHMGGTN